MAKVTIKVIDGQERGFIYEELEPPVSIGREEDNIIQLNDERLSRFHSKIQEVNGQLIFTDLDSTNGSRINGIPVQIHVLKPGDHIEIGRTLLVYGSDEQIAERISEIPGSHSVELNDSGTSGASFGTIDSSVKEEALADCQFDYATLFSQACPELPQELDMLQRTKLSDYLTWLHAHLSKIITSAHSVEIPQEDESGEATPGREINWEAWQQLLKLETQLSQELKKLAEPEE